MMKKEVARYFYMNHNNNKKRVEPNSFKYSSVFQDLSEPFVQLGVNNNDRFVAGAGAGPSGLRSSSEVQR